MLKGGSLTTDSLILVPGMIGNIAKIVSVHFERFVKECQ